MTNPETIIGSFSIIDLAALKEQLKETEDPFFSFSKDIIDKLGQPYVSKNSKGMGLGIFISKNLINNLNGDINFYNSKENNAVVNVIFNQCELMK